jgi:hypothetical protein
LIDYDGTTANLAGVAVRTVSGSTTDFDVVFGRYLKFKLNTFTATAWDSTSIVSGTKWRLAKYSSVGGTELAPATYNSAGSITRENTWTSYTPTISAGFGTATSNSAFYKVLGDSLFIRGSFTTGTVAASIASISIPAGYTISSSKLSLANTTASAGNILGKFNAPNNSCSVVSATGTSTSLVYIGALANNASVNIPQNGTVIAGSTAVCSYYFEVPIV